MIAQTVRTVTDWGSDETEIRKIVQQVEDGWNVHDLTAFAAPFADDADYVVVNGSHVTGRAAIAVGHQHIFDTIYRRSINRGTVAGIRFLREDVAVVHVHWQLAIDPDDGTRTGHAIAAMVMTRKHDGWQIAAFQNTPVVNGRTSP